VAGEIRGADLGKYPAKPRWPVGLARRHARGDGPRVRGHLSAAGGNGFGKGLGRYGSAGDGRGGRRPAERSWPAKHGNTHGRRQGAPGVQPAAGSHGKLLKILPDFAGPAPSLIRRGRAPPTSDGKGSAPFAEGQRSYPRRTSTDARAREKPGTVTDDLLYRRSGCKILRIVRVIPNRQNRQIGEPAPGEFRGVRHSTPSPLRLAFVPCLPIRSGRSNEVARHTDCPEDRKGE
jgi:hypothetical protein